MRIYHKERLHTVLFLLLYLAMCHTAVWAFLFGIDNSVRILGLPLHFFLIVVCGWLGLTGVAFWWSRAAEKLEQEITGSAFEEPDAGPLPTKVPAAASAT